MKTFFNILPPEKKDDLRLLRWHRVIARQMAGLLFLVLFFVVLLSGIGFLLTLEKGSVLEKNAERQRQDEVYARIAAYEGVFSQTQALLPSVEQTLKNQKKVTWIFHALEKKVPQEISFLSILLSDNTLKLTGQADTRDHLLALQDKLRETQCFSDVVLPWDQIAKKERIDFEISISIDAQCF